MSTFPSHAGYSFPGLDNLHHDIYPAISVKSTRELRQPGKVVLITGAGRGIGRAIALQYAHASASAIILCARTGTEIDEVEKEVKNINSAIRVHKYRIDVSDSDAVTRLAQDITSKEGRLDALINNAGASSEWAKIADCGVEGWWNAMEVNLKGPFLFIHALVPLLVATAEKGGKPVHIINVSSIGAHTLVPGSSAYSISKLAVLRLTEYVDAEYAEQGVVALGLHPGGVETELSRRYDAVKPFLIDTPELCGGFAVWFTAESRSWLAGRYVSATWDVSVLEGMKDEIVKENKLKVVMKI